MVKLQRRHFEYIADVLLGLKPTMSDDDHGKLVRYFSNLLGMTNAQFKDDRFYNRARGIKPAPYRVRKAAAKAGAVRSVPDEEANYWE